MRRRLAFQPTALDALETRRVPSAATVHAALLTQHAQAVELRLERTIAVQAARLAAHHAAPTIHSAAAMTTTGLSDNLFGAAGSLANYATFTNGIGVSITTPNSISGVPNTAISSNSGFGYAFTSYQIGPGYTPSTVGGGVGESLIVSSPNGINSGVGLGYNDNTNFTNTSGYTVGLSYVGSTPAINGLGLSTGSASPTYGLNNGVATAYSGSNTIPFPTSLDSFSNGIGLSNGTVFSNTATAVNTSGTFSAVVGSGMLYDPTSSLGAIGSSASGTGFM